MRHLPLGPFVVHNVASRELAQSKGAWARNKLTLLARHPGTDGQGGEIVSGQESFTCQIAIRIEIALVAADVDLEQKIALTECFLLARRGPVLGVRTSSA